MEHRGTEHGVTLIEILVVLAILGFMGVAAMGGIARLTQADLRRDAAKLAAAMRSAYDRAAATAAHHRLVIDLDEETFQLERCEGKIKLRRTIDEAEAEEAAAIAAQAAAPPDQAAAAAEPAQGAQVGMATCAPVKGELGGLQAFKKKRGIGIARVHVGHLAQPATEGKVTVNFFPLGRAERAVVEVADDDGDVYSIIVHPITGRVELRTGEWKRPEEFVTEDAEGRTVE